MKALYTHDRLISDIKDMDKRAESLTDAQIDMVINDGYSEIAQYCHPFTNEEVVSMKEYYDISEEKLSLDLGDDVAYIYDLYGTNESTEPLSKIYDSNAIYQDGRYVGRVHVNLDYYPNYGIDNIVIKFAYNPEATADDIMVDKSTYSLMVAAFRVALDIRFKDDEREILNRKRLEQKCINILPHYPQDYMMV